LHIAFISSAEGIGAKHLEAKCRLQLQVTITLSQMSRHLPAALEQLWCLSKYLLSCDSNMSPT